MTAPFAGGPVDFSETALAGEPGAVLDRIAEYQAAGVTDLTCAFADFPEAGMLERFAEQVLPMLARRRAARNAENIGWQ